MEGLSAYEVAMRYVDNGLFVFCEPFDEGVHIHGLRVFWARHPMAFDPDGIVRASALIGMAEAAMKAARSND